MSISNIPQNTGIPFVIDSNVQNTLDFHCAVTDFTNIVILFSNEIALSYIWNYTKVKNDPILAQAQFFNQLNKSTFNLPNNSEGTKNPNIKSYFRLNNSIHLNQDEIWVTTNDGVPVSRIDPSTGHLQYQVKINKVNGESRFIDVLESVDSKVSEFLSNLKSDFGEKNMIEEVVLFWIDRYENSLKQVQEEYKNLDPDFDTGIFQPLSDSIGIITRYDENYQEVNLTLTDPSLSALNLLPNMYPPIIGDKLDSEQKKMILEFTDKCTYVHRHNLQFIRKNRDVGFLSNYPHGENLISDDNYWLIIGQLKDTLLGTIAKVLDKANRLFAFKKVVGNETNNQVLTKALFNIIQENTTMTVDLLKNQFDSLQKEALNDRFLSVSR